MKTLYVAVLQDKYPPGRITAGAGQPVTAKRGAVNRQPGTKPTRTHIIPKAVNRQGRHGSETRKTAQVAARVPFHVKSEVARLATLKGWTESKTVAVLIEQALAGTLAEQFGVMLKKTIQEAVTTQLAKDNNRTANLALEAFYSSEQGRIITIYLLRFLLGQDIELLPQIIKDSQDQARENMGGCLAGDQQQPWQS